MARPDRLLNIICFATFFKGGDFMRECKAQGCNVILVTKEKMLNEDWPRDVLEEFDVVVAALAREHLCLSGMSSSTAKTFRDKYSMAVKARDTGLTVPEFVPAINNEEIAEYLGRVPPPWVLKPRSDVSAIGIRKLDNADNVWKAIDELNKREALRE